MDLVRDDGNADVPTRVSADASHATATSHL